VLCLCIRKFRSRQPLIQPRDLSAAAPEIATFGPRNSGYSNGPNLFRIESERLELPAPFGGRIATLDVLLIITFRPEFNAPWVGQPHVTSLTLNRLGEREAAAIIARLVANKELPADVMAEIVERTDGIPLFVEEMTKAVLEAEREDAARRTATTVPSRAHAVPASLHASLMARLDRLGPAKELAQIGAAIGREFSHAQLASVARETGAFKGRASFAGCGPDCVGVIPIRECNLDRWTWCETP
jgi:hypothetical protein